MGDGSKLWGKGPSGPLGEGCGLDFELEVFENKENSYAMTSEARARPLLGAVCLAETQLAAYAIAYAILFVPE
jgi:hypothetical protein